MGEVALIGGNRLIITVTITITVTVITTTTPKQEGMVGQPAPVISLPSHSKASNLKTETSTAIILVYSLRRRLEPMEELQQEMVIAVPAVTWQTCAAN